MQKSPGESFFTGLFLLVFFVDLTLREWASKLSEIVCNEGVGLGLTMPISLLWLIIGIIGIFLLIKRERALTVEERLAWTLVLLGGLGNALDRLFQGCVTDYLHLPFFPSFNIADIMLFLGVLWLSLRLLGVLRRS